MLLQAGEVDDADRVLVAAGNGPETNGWLFAVDDPLGTRPRTEVLDHLNTSGLVCVGDRLYRVLSSPSEPHASGDFLVYDRSGALVYRRVDGLADTHGLIWDGEHFAVPCSFTNEIFWLTASGEPARVWRAPGEGDAWHINGVHARGGRLYASAFGRFETHRGWAERRGERTGLIFDVETQAAVVSNLACPHDPLFVDGGWLVCDSYTKRLVFVNEASGAVVREAQLTGWSRGLCVTAQHIFVGISGERHAQTGKAKARIIVLERTTLRAVGEIALPCEEITTLTLVPRALLAGIRRGFRTNDLRVAVQDRRDLFAGAGQDAPALPQTPMQPIDRPRDFRVRIRVKAPRQTVADRPFEVRISIKNRSKRALLTAPPFPVNVALVFHRIDGPSESPEVRREALPEPLMPGRTIRFTLAVQSPSVAGRYRVRFTLLQEWVRWFDNDERPLARLMSTNRRDVRLMVRAATGVSGEGS